MAGADRLESEAAVAAQTPKLVLASGSPQRRRLLAEAGYDFAVVPPRADVESDSLPGESPCDLVSRLAREKALDVAHRVGGGIVVACDTVAACDGNVLGKPVDADDARRMLTLLSGREHCVYSGLCLIALPDCTPRVRVATTRLRMDALDPAQISEYLASGLWRGKAGAFGYQDRPGWLHITQGSESNVIGLPLDLLADMLAELPPS